MGTRQIQTFARFSEEVGGFADEWRNTMLILGIDPKEIKKLKHSYEGIDKCQNMYQVYRKGVQAVLAHVHEVDLDELSDNLVKTLIKNDAYHLSTEDLKSVVAQFLQSKLCSTQEDK
jgi:hypothetical protein